MALVKQKNGTPATSRNNFLSDFFNTDRFFSDPFFTREEGVPAVNVSENDSHYEIEMAVPGMKKEDFSINVENGVLNISGESKSDTENTGKNYTRKEFSYTTFSRSFSLPENADEENVSAKYDNGVLRLTLAKKSPGSSSKKREVTVG